MQVVSQARRLSRALKSPILLNSDRFLAPDFRFLESPLTSLQCPNHHSFSSLSPCFSGTSTFVCFFVFCLVTEKVVVKRKHGNEFEIVENKEQTKSCIETLVFFFFFLNDTFGAECEPFFTFIFRYILFGYRESCWKKKAQKWIWICWKRNWKSLIK